MGKTLHGHRIDIIFVFVVFCVFATSVLVVLTLGGSIYKSMSEKLQDGYVERTSLSYIWSKVKNGDESGGVFVDCFHGQTILCLAEEYDQVRYLTRIYLYDGWIHELVSEEGLEFSLSDGQPVMEAETLDFERLEGGIIKVTSNSRSMYLYSRTYAELS